MSYLVNSPDVLLALRQRKRYVRMKLQASRTRMKEGVSLLPGMSPARGKARTLDRVQVFARIAMNGILAYRGYRLCMNVVRTIRSLFSTRRRRNVH